MDMDLFQLIREDHIPSGRNMTNQFMNTPIRFPNDSHFFTFAVPANRNFSGCTPSESAAQLGLDAGR